MTAFANGRGIVTTPMPTAGPLVNRYETFQLFEPVLDDDDAKIIAVLGHEKTLAFWPDVVALMAHQIECVGAVEKHDRCPDIQTVIRGIDARRKQFSTSPKENLSSIRCPDR